jgi:Uma2 family endonuclease
LESEVVSSNWQDDFLLKIAEYEKLGIGEYWIVDYLGLGGRRYIGNPKQPTISVYYLVDDEYTVELFRGEDILRSHRDPQSGAPSFRELTLTAEQIFQSGL